MTKNTDREKKISKAKIKEKAGKKDYDFFNDIIQKGDVRDIITMLSKLGKLPSDFNSDIFLKLIDHDSEKVRLLAAKNLGKVVQKNDLEKIKNSIDNEKNTDVVRELYSAAGRLKKEGNIPILMDGLENKSGKIVMQCIRGLLYHKNNEKVYDRLAKLRNHPNEIIREIVDRELFSEYKKSEEKKPHPHVYKELKNKLVLGDSKEVLKRLPDNCIHLTFTSPPYYNAKDYSVYRSYEEYLEFIISIVQEVHRVTKEGRFFVLNTSPVLIPRFSRKYSSKRYLIPYDLHPRIIDLGFDFVEEIVWKKPEASAIHRNGGFYQHRKPLAYKANHSTESVVVYRKNTHRLIDWNIKQYSDKIIEKSKVEDDDYFKSNVWEIAPSSSKVHPAVFPTELAENVIKFYSMIGDLVMDPFAGTCTVAEAAKNLKRSFFMIEKEKEYLDYAHNELIDLSKWQKESSFNYLKFNEFEKKVNNLE